MTKKTIQSTVLYKIKVKQAWTKSKMSAKTENWMVAYLYSMRIIKLRRSLLSALGMILLWELGRSPYGVSFTGGRSWCRTCILLLSTCLKSSPHKCSHSFSCVGNSGGRRPNLLNLLRTDTVKAKIFECCSFCETVDTWPIMGRQKLK